ncbi:MAG: hypothetical protein ACK559_01765, partial [bacterium]
MLQGVVPHEAAGLHVVDAGAEDGVALAADTMRGGKRADRMDRVEMAEDEDTLLVRIAPGRFGLEDVAEPVAAGDALD